MEVTALDIQTVPESFAQLKSDLASLAGQTLAIAIGGVDDTQGIKDAKTQKSLLVKIRGSVEARRKELKSISLQYGKAVDSQAGSIAKEIRGMENHLVGQLDCVRKEQAKIAQQLLVDRQNTLAGLLYEAPNAFIGSLSNAKFDALLIEVKAGFKDRKNRRDEQEAEKRELEELRALKLEVVKPVVREENVLSIQPDPVEHEKEELTPIQYAIMILDGKVEANAESCIQLASMVKENI